jgi:CTP synthase
LATLADSVSRKVSIALVGKYTGLSDAYLSVIKALQHACLAHNVKLDLKWIDSSFLEDDECGEYKSAWAILKEVQGILIPGGFGARGTMGKILATQFAREYKIPFFGICLGMQVAVIEYARHVLGLSAAHSTEFEDTRDPVIINMPELSTTHMGGSMRLGARKTLIEAKTLASEIYGKSEVIERHRHRYEVNPEYIQPLEKAGLLFSGHDERKQRMEIVELPQGVHPFFLGVQFHPEFLTRPYRPHPMFSSFIQASVQNL